MPAFFVGLVVGIIALAAIWEQKPVKNFVVGRLPAGRPFAMPEEPVFSLEQEKWGRVEALSPTPNGYVYGIRFRNGQAVVLRDNQIVK